MFQKLQETILQYPDSKIFSLNYFTHNKLIKNSIEHEIVIIILQILIKLI